MTFRCTYTCRNKRSDGFFYTSNSTWRLRRAPTDAVLQLTLSHCRPRSDQTLRYFAHTFVTDLRIDKKLAHTLITFDSNFDATSTRRGSDGWFASSYSPPLQGRGCKNRIREGSGGLGVRPPSCRTLHCWRDGSCSHRDNKLELAPPNGIKQPSNCSPPPNLELP